MINKYIFFDLLIPNLQTSRPNVIEQLFSLFCVKILQIGKAGTAEGVSWHTYKIVNNDKNFIPLADRGTYER